MIEKEGVKIAFGLEAQGHIQTIEQVLIYWNDNKYNVDMTYSKCVWDQIGKKIGWCPFTAALAYFKYKEQLNQ